jgi:hypothetical protein
VARMAEKRLALLALLRTPCAGNGPLKAVSARSRLRLATPPRSQGKRSAHERR